MWFLLDDFNPWKMIHIHVVWRVYLWCVFFISRISLLLLPPSPPSLSLLRCSHLVCLCVVFAVAAFLMYNYNSPTAWHYRISCYFISFHCRSLARTYIFICASNISYLIILMCLIVCLKVFHPLSTGTNARRTLTDRQVHIICFFGVWCDCF